MRKVCLLIGHLAFSNQTLKANSMLICLENDVANIDFGENEQYAAAIEALFASVRLGRHFVTASRTTLQTLSKSMAFSSITRKIISRIDNEIAQVYQLIDRTEWRVSVSPSYISIKKDLNSKIFCVPLGDLDHINSCVLLGENLDDTRVFHYAAKHYAVAHKLSACDCFFEKDNGGGATTPQVLEQRLNEHKWCLVITDSDRKSPKGCAHTPVSSHCKRIVENSQKVALHISLPSHEVENFVPPAISGAALHPHGNAALIDDVVIKSKIVGQELYLHTDLKLGMTVKRMQTFPPASPDRQYWDEVANQLSIAKQVTLCCDINSETCAHDVCKCYVTAQVENKLLVKVIDYLERNSAHETYKQAKSCPWIGGWLSLGKTIFEWGLAHKPMRG